jgi:hypothetical protein
MSAKRVTLALGVTAAALTVAAVSVHATPVGTAANPEKIKFISRATPVNTVVDVGPAGSSPGDIYVFVDDVFLTTAPSTKVGQALGRCTLVDAETGKFGCSIITTLPGGTITTDGTLINGSPEPLVGAITGGTGRYRNARGEGALSLGPPEGPHTVTLSVILQP